MKLEQIKSFVLDRRAVSPVLGVALLIAITVILAGVIGFVVLGVGTGNADVPDASLAGEWDGTNFDIVHKGGDVLEVADLKIVVDGTATTQTWAAGNNPEWKAGNSEQIEGTISATSVVRVVWMDPNSDREVLIAELNVD